MKYYDPVRAVMFVPFFRNYNWVLYVDVTLVLNLKSNHAGTP